MSDLREAPSVTTNTSYRDTKLLKDNMLGCLVGRLKEVIEATTPDKEQREAVKNIIADKVYEWYRVDLGWKFSQDELQEVTDKRYAEEYPCVEESVK